MVNDLIENRSTEYPEIFHARFWRCYRLLQFLACRVLGGTERVYDAVENCWLAASRNPPRFEYESAFRSWVARVLIDEALALRRQEEGNAQDNASRYSFGVPDQLHENEAAC